MLSPIKRVLAVQLDGVKITPQNAGLIAAERAGEALPAANEEERVARLLSNLSMNDWTAAVAKQMIDSILDDLTLRADDSILSTPLLASLIRSTGFSQAAQADAFIVSLLDAAEVKIADIGEEHIPSTVADLKARLSSITFGQFFLEVAAQATLIQPMFEQLVFLPLVAQTALPEGFDVPVGFIQKVLVDWEVLPAKFKKVFANDESKWSDEDRAAYFAMTLTLEHCFQARIPQQPSVECDAWPDFVGSKFYRNKQVNNFKAVAKEFVEFMNSAPDVEGEDLSREADESALSPPLAHPVTPSASAMWASLRKKRKAAADEAAAARSAKRRVTVTPGAPQAEVFYGCTVEQMRANPADHHRRWVSSSEQSVEAYVRFENEEEHSLVHFVESRVNAGKAEFQYMASNGRSGWVNVLTAAGMMAVARYAEAADKEAGLSGRSAAFREPPGSSASIPDLKASLRALDREEHTTLAAMIECANLQHHRDETSRFVSLFKLKQARLVSEVLSALDIQASASKPARLVAESYAFRQLADRVAKSARDRTGFRADCRCILQIAYGVPLKYGINTLIVSPIKEQLSSSDDDAPEPPTTFTCGLDGASGLPVFTPASSSKDTRVASKLSTIAQCRQAIDILVHVLTEFHGPEIATLAAPVFATFPRVATATGGRANAARSFVRDVWKAWGTSIRAAIREARGAIPGSAPFGFDCAGVMKLRLRLLPKNYTEERLPSLVAKASQQRQADATKRALEAADEMRKAAATAADENKKMLATLQQLQAQVKNAKPGGGGGGKGKAGGGASPKKPSLPKAQGKSAKPQGKTKTGATYPPAAPAPSPSGRAPAPAGGAANAQEWKKVNLGRADTFFKDPDALRKALYSQRPPCLSLKQAIQEFAKTEPGLCFYAQCAVYSDIEGDCPFGPNGKNTCPFEPCKSARGTDD